MEIVNTIREKLSGFLMGKVMEDGKHSKSWASLWSKGHEWQMGTGNVSDPYAQVIAVYNSIKAIADNVPQAKLKLYKSADKQEEANDTKWEELLRKPNPLMSQSDFMQSLVGFLSLKGAAFIVKTLSVGNVAGTTSVPLELWVFDPDKFTAVKNRHTGELEGWKYGKYQYGVEEVVYIKDWNPNDILKPLPPTVPLRNILDIDYQSLIYNKAFFDNYGIPNSFMVAKEGLGDDERTRLKQWFKKRFTGASKAFKMALIEGDLDIKTIASTHKDMEFLEQKRFTREEIYGAWRVPKALFNITDDLNYATFSGQMKVFWTYGIMPKLRKIEDALNAQLHDPAKSGFWFGFDVSNVVAYQEDFNDKVDVAEKLFNMGFTRNEVNKRLELGFQDSKWGDSWWIPFNLVPAGSAPVEPVDNSAAPKQIDAPVDKSVETVDKSNDSAVWKQFLVRHSGIEGKFVKALKVYFWEQRKASLKQLELQKDISINLDWEEWNKELKKTASPHIRAGVDEGVKFSEDFIPMPDNAILESQIKTSIDTFYAARVNLITQVNDTVKLQIAQAVADGNAAGETAVQIADRVRNIYNMASTRTLLIARTETTAAMNGASSLYYRENNVKFKRWIVADDEARGSHKMNAVQGILEFNKPFANGQEYPGAPAPASEVCNCRCTLVPVISE